MIDKLPLLKYLNVDKCDQIGNQILETALSTQQTIELFCRKTNVNPNEFKLRHQESVFYENKKSDPLYYNGFKYVCKQLTFWSDKSLIYM